MRLIPNNSQLLLDYIEVYMGDAGLLHRQFTGQPYLKQLISWLHWGVYLNKSD
jgi:hypothetical protein